MDNAPVLALSLAAAGALAALAALALRGRRFAPVPLLLWWTLWVLAALGSVVNTLE